MTKRSHLLGGAMLVGAMSACPAPAQSTGQSLPPAAYPATADLRTPGLGEIVVTARRRAENLQNVPVAVTALTSVKLQQNRIALPEDVQYLTPGLTVQGGNFNREGNNYSIRGQAPGGTIVYRDEVPTLSASSSGGAITVPYFDLESIQVLKGPQGTLFGGTTTGGAVLISTAKPTGVFGGYIQGSYGNLDARYLEGAINIPIVSDKIDLRIAGSLRRRDGYTKNLYTGGHVDNQNTDAIRATLSIAPVDGLKNVTVYEYNYRNEKIGNSLPFLCNPGGTLAQVPGYLAACQAGIALGPRTINEFPTGRGLIKEHFLSNVTSLDITDTLVVKNIFGFIHDAVGNRQDADGTTFLQSAVVNPFTRYFLNKTEQYSDELQLQGKNFDNRLTWILGGFYERGRNPEFAHLFAAVGLPFLVDVDQKGRYSEKAVFGQATYDFSNLIHGLSLTGGVRYTKDDSTNISGTNFCADAPIGTPTALCGAEPFAYSPEGINAGVSPLSTSAHAVTYNVTVDYKPTKGLLLYVARRHGFRPGGIQAFGGNSDEFKTFLPETVDDTEIGVKSEFRLGNVPTRLNVAAFSDQYNNQQRTVSVGPTVSPTLNAQKARIRGIELEGTIIPVRWFTLDFNYAYIDAKFTKFLVPIGDLEVAQGLIPPNDPGAHAILDESSSPFALTPRNAFDITGTVTLPVSERSTIALSANYGYRGKTYFASDTFFQQQLVQPGYGLLNLQLKWANAAGLPLDVSVFAKNVTNKVYIDGDGNDTYAANPVLGTGVDTVFYGEPRTYGVTLRYQFGERH